MCKNSSTLLPESSLKTGKPSFLNPKLCSTSTLVRHKEALNVCYVSFWGVKYGVIKNRLQGYPESPNKNPLCSTKYACIYVHVRVFVDIYILPNKRDQFSVNYVNFRFRNSSLYLKLIYIYIYYVFRKNYFTIIFFTSFKLLTKSRFPPDPTIVNTTRPVGGYTNETIIGITDHLFRMEKISKYTGTL